MLLSVLDVPLANTIFVPSGDQRGPKQPWEPGSEEAPPHAGCACTGISCSLLPSACTTQIELRAPRVTCCENTISLPCGDQSPKELSNATGTICRSRLSLSLTTYRPSAAGSVG